MQIATWNVNGIRARESQFLEWIARDRPEVICLQEIKARGDQLSLALGTLSEYHSYWHGGGGYSGVSIHFRKDHFPASTPLFTHPPFDIENRIVTAQVGNTIFASVYIPNGGKDYDAKITFMTALDAYIADTRSRGLDLIICGDLNVARSDADVYIKDRTSDTIGQREDERAIFERWLSHDLIDVARALDPDNQSMFTWWPYWRDARKKNRGWRIDYILASRPIAANAKRCTILTEVGTSDHAPVVVELTDLP